jgi:hypothetical protein
MCNNERSLENDLKYGLERETIEGILGINFNEDFKNTKDLYNDPFYPYDFEGLTTKTSVELKSRRVNKSAYETTIIPVHKVRKTNYKQLFCFNFTDDICYIEYNKELFNTFERKDIMTYRKGIVDKPKPHFLIPIHLLISLKKNV